MKANCALSAQGMKNLSLTSKAANQGWAVPCINVTISAVFGTMAVKRAMLAFNCL